MRSTHLRDKTEIEVATAARHRHPRNLRAAALHLPVLLLLRAAVRPTLTTRRHWISPEKSIIRRKRRTWLRCWAQLQSMEPITNSSSLYMTSGSGRPSVRRNPKWMARLCTWPCQDTAFRQSIGTLVTPLLSTWSGSWGIRRYSLRLLPTNGAFLSTSGSETRCRSN